MRTKGGPGSAGLVTAGAFFTLVLARPAAGQVTSRVSVDSGGAQGNSYSFEPTISADGRTVAFWSEATNLVGWDPNGASDVFVRDLESATTALVSVATDGTQGDGDSSRPAISADGRLVAFLSEATNLVAGDTNGTYDIFVRDRQSGTTECMSVATSG